MQTETTDTAGYTADDLPELEKKLAKLLRAQYADTRSVREIKREMTSRQREIDALSGTIEQIEDQALEARLG